MSNFVSRQEFSQILRSNLKNLGDKTFEHVFSAVAAFAERVVADEIRRRWGIEQTRVDAERNKMYRDMQDEYLGYIAAREAAEAEQEVYQKAAFEVRAFLKGAADGLISAGDCLVREAAKSKEKLGEPLPSPLEKVVPVEGHSKVVRFTGHLSPEDVAGLHDARTVVFPAKEYDEMMAVLSDASKMLEKLGNIVTNEGAELPEGYDSLAKRLLPPMSCIDEACYLTPEAAQKAVDVIQEAREVISKPAITGVASGRGVAIGVAMKAVTEAPAESVPDDAPSPDDMPMKEVHLDILVTPGPLDMEETGALPSPGDDKEKTEG